MTHFKVHNITISSCYRMTMAAVICCLSTSLTLAQSTIAKLEFNGEPVNTLNISYALPKQKPAVATVQVNQKFDSGTLFIIPAQTVVWLASNGNKQRLGPGSKHLASAGPKGESHQTFWGKVEHFVSNKLNFYKASGPSSKHQGAVKGTIFTVEAIGKDVKFSTQEGTVAIERQVKLNIQEKSKNNLRKQRELTATKTTLINAGDPEELFNHSYEEEVPYESYDQAIQFFGQELERAYENGVDAETIVGEYTLLGELYLDAADPTSAVEAFETAIELYEDELDPDDPGIAENHIGLGEANYNLKNYDKGVKHCNIALAIISEDLEFNKEDFEYFSSIEDYETAWSIGLDIVDNYDNLGWCYDILNNYDESDKFYDMAEAMEAQLKQY
ncbi:tetratricopeptide repeat protein [Kriegella aquimaris]|uniref:Tetratricopeptide repeat-containing protein n=1 Tax=Kriegella aquimaris TaxID=192904 RepID=A0A1G9RAV2_9FLAO|nr:tetratricopeptide repeat protein [Kriegella aquimaris]SDM20354.1 Tetratricopeptide repeat-containing protein [Kriegella aquimaris]